MIPQRRRQALVQAGIAEAIFRPETISNSTEAKASQQQKHLATIYPGASHFIKQFNPARHLAINPGIDIKKAG